MSNATTSPVERATLSVEETAAYLGIGRSLAYRLAREGELPTVRLGGRMLVPRCRLEALLEERPARLSTLDEVSG